MRRLRARLTHQQARAYVLKLSRRRRDGADVWNPRFSRKRPRERANLVASRALPVATLNLAAMAVQRHVRGHQVRLLLVLLTASDEDAKCRLPTAARAAGVATARRQAAHRERREKACGGAEGGGEGGASPRISTTEVGLISRFLEAKMAAGADADGNELTFYQFVLLHLQAWARMLPWRTYAAIMRQPLLEAGALSIQLAWRRCRSAVQSRPASASSSGRAILSVQRAWRAYADKQIFRYFRDMIRFREQGDPRLLLRCINPREAKLMDAACAVHVRFRLGGATFPPTIFYKVYTHGSVTDVNAFAPRDYTAEFQPPPLTLHNHAKPGEARPPPTSVHKHNWYVRVENNGWRPVAERVLADPDDVVVSGVAKSVEWSHVKLERRADQARRRKEKKLNWMHAMYAQGRAADDAAADGGLPDGGEGEDVDELLRWTDALDFDAYYQDWLGMATSARPEWQGAERAFAT